MPKRYEQLRTLVRACKPKVIVEVGTHEGKRAELMCREAVKYQERVHYIGYDLFEEATPETDKREMNGKGPGSIQEATERLKAIDGLTFEFIKGDTRKTLHGQDVRADFAFIDGGHSVETIRGDYEALKASRMIALDDYYSGDYDPDTFGCNRMLESIPHEVLPDIEKTNHKGVKVQIAVVGYNSKWQKAIDRVMKDEGHRDFVLWRGNETMRADLVCACNTLEHEVDIDAALGQIKKLIRKRFFFTLKADAMRGLPWWRKKLEEHFQLLEWMEPPGGEAVGTGMPLAVLGEWQSRGVMDDDARFQQTAENVKTIAKRVEYAAEPNGRQAIIVCYGPSLLQTWPEVAAERKFFDADIFSVSGSHDFLIRREIIPDFHVECDPRRHKADNLTLPNEKVKYLIASCCHPEYVEKLKDYDTALWHLCNGQDSFRITEELESEKGQLLLTGGGSVGLRAISLAYAMGYREFHIYGMDCSFSQGFSESTDLKKVQERQWAGPHKGKQQKVITVKSEGGLWFKTSPVLVTYTRHFFDTVQRAPDAKFYLAGDGLLQHMAKLSMEQKPEAA